jgi:iron complex outermembrane receptor protein
MFNFNVSAAVFNRKSDHLIDYVKIKLRILGKAQKTSVYVTQVLNTTLYSFNLIHLLKSYNLVIHLFRMI